MGHHDRYRPAAAFAERARCGSSRPWPADRHGDLPDVVDYIVGMLSSKTVERMAV